jgi:hypothetical protein
MKEFARNLLPAAILAGFCCGAAMAADLSTVGQLTNKYPFDNIATGKSLWGQPGVQAAMRAVRFEPKTLQGLRQRPLLQSCKTDQSPGAILGGRRRRLDGLPRCRKTSPV